MKQLYAKYVNDNAGREDEREEAKELFIFHQFYPVEKIDMGQSHTSVTLKGFKGSFNSVFFEFSFMILKLEFGYLTTYLPTQIITLTLKERFIGLRVQMEKIGYSKLMMLSLQQVADLEE